MTFYILFYITMSVFSPFVNVHLSRIGFSGTQIGMINSAGMIFSMITAPLFGMISDKLHRPKTVIGALLIASGISILIWKKQTVFLPVLISYIALSSFRNDLPSLCDGLAVRYCESENQDYGIIRSMGSLGYILGGFVIVTIASLAGFEGPYAVIFAAASFAAAFLLLSFPNIESAKKEKVLLLQDGKKLIRNKDFLFITLLYILTMTAMDTVNNFIGNHLIETMHASDSAIGLYNLFSVLPETIIVFFTSRLVRLAGYRKLYIMACLTQTLRLIVYMLSGNLAVFLVFSMVHGLMVCVSSVGNMHFISKAIDPKILSTAVSLYNAAAMIACAAFSWLFGVLYEYAGTSGIFACSALLSVIASVLVIRSKLFKQAQDA